MKKTHIIALLLAIAMSFCTIESKAGSNLFYITLGKGSDCKGYNICNIQVCNSTNIDATKVQAIASIKENKLVLAFQKTSISSQVFLNYFSTGFFVIDEDFVLPNVVLENLQIKNTILKAGKYKITDTANSYIVQF